MVDLVDTLMGAERRGVVIEDCCTLIDEEVKSKTGISGLAIKAGYKTLKGVRPAAVRQAVTELLPDFVSELAPLHKEARGEGKSMSEFFSAHSDRAADALLSVTDRRAGLADKGIVKVAYEKLRPMAQKNVCAALPRLGQLVDKHLDK